VRRRPVIATFAALCVVGVTHALTVVNGSFEGGPLPVRPQSPDGALSRATSTTPAAWSAPDGTRSAGFEWFRAGGIRQDIAPLPDTRTS